MKILVINTADIRGGAAIASCRLHSAMKESLGIEYRLLAGDTYGAERHSQSTRTPPQWLFEKMLDRVTRAFGLQYLWFPFSGRTILDTAKTFRPDIIHLQNLHGGFFPLQLLPRLSRIAPLVWTLHDMWSFLGNAAYALGDLSWQVMQPGPNEHHIPPTIGLPTGRGLMQRKRQIYRDANITFVCPSSWLYQQALHSPVLHGRKVHHIPYGINTEIFVPGSKARAREILNLPMDGKILLFCNGGTPGNPWKGEKYIGKILQCLSELSPTTLHLVYLGTPPQNQRFKHISGSHFPGLITCEKTMVRYYQAADVLLYPSQADNLPNVLLEAAACGLPAVTYNVGGCSEIVIPQIGGEVVELNNLQHFVAATQTLVNLGKEEQAQRAAVSRNHILENYSVEKIADRYFQLFTRICRKPEFAAREV